MFLCTHVLQSSSSSGSCVLVLTSLFCLFVSSKADKDVDDYYSRKRHLPDLAARGTLPLHVLKLGQDQVGILVRLFDFIHEDLSSVLDLIKKKN